MLTQRTTLSFILLSLGTALPAPAAVIEIPGPDSTVSGVGSIAGWKCDFGAITVQVDDDPPLPAATGIGRGDTEGVCGDVNNGFITQYNFGLAGPGSHTVRAFDDGVEFASHEFTVTTVGQSFAQGLSGRVHGHDFPALEQRVRLDWTEATQSFVLTELCGKDTPLVCPPPRCADACEDPEVVPKAIVLGARCLDGLLGGAQATVNMVMPGYGLSERPRCRVHLYDASDVEVQSQCQIFEANPGPGACADGTIFSYGCDLEVACSDIERVELECFEGETVVVDCDVSVVGVPDFG